MSNVDRLSSETLRELIAGAERRVETLKVDRDDLDARARPLSPYEVISMCEELLVSRGEVVVE